MGENTPSRTVYDRARAAVRQADPRTFTYELADALLVERDARQAAERRASWWETAAADAAMDRRVLEARVAALEEALREANTAYIEQYELAERLASSLVAAEDALRRIVETHPLSPAGAGARMVARDLLGVQSTPTETTDDLPRERSDAERLVALNELRVAEGNAPLSAMPPESSWDDAQRVTFGADDE